MRRKARFLLAFTALTSLLLSAVDASGQYYRRYRRADVDRAIKQAENASDEFVQVFDRNLDNSALNGSEREDRLNDRAKDLERRLDRLRHDFDGRTNWWEARATAADALEYARGINNAMRARRYSPRCEEMWYRLRANLNAVARYYDLAQLGR